MLIAEKIFKSQDEILSIIGVQAFREGTDGKKTVLRRRHIDSRKKELVELDLIGGDAVDDLQGA